MAMRIYKGEHVTHRLNSESRGMESGHEVDGTRLDCRWDCWGACQPVILWASLCALPPGLTV